MADLRQELVAQHSHGPEIYVGQLCLRASEEIRRLENRVHDLDAMISGARASLRLAHEREDG